MLPNCSASRRAHAAPLVSSPGTEYVPLTASLSSTLQHIYIYPQTLSTYSTVDMFGMGVWLCMYRNWFYFGYACTYQSPLGGRYVRCVLYKNLFHTLSIYRATLPRYLHATLRAIPSLKALGNCACIHILYIICI